MEMASISLELLPIEIQCSIFRLVDPIGLISISQTNSKLRNLIKPTKTHLAERLLALESLEKYGGGTPIFRSRDNSLEPSWTSQEWERIRWACTGCLRLLSHTHFDNHSLLRLAYRKPIPNSPAANLRTSWEHSRKGKHWGRTWRRNRCSGSTVDEQKLRRRYSIAVSYQRPGFDPWGDPPTPHNSLVDFQDSGMKEFQGMSSLEFEGLSEREEQAILDNEARAVELERCGLKRHLRRCNECRYRRGELKPGVDGSGGTLKVPMVKSRHLDFGSTLDRYFPGFSDALGVERPLFNAPVYLIYRGDAHETFWTMRMVRCPACAIWQELRAFRFGGIFPKWQPMVDSTYFEEGFRTWEQSLLTKPLIDGLLCNNCFAKEHGRQELAEILTKWIKRLLTLEHWRLKCQLGNGWGWLESSMQYIPKEYKPEIKAMLQDTWPLIRNDDVELSRADTALLRMRHAQWMELLKRIETEGNRTWISENEWFSYWMHLYDESDAHWDWIRECRQETEQNGDALVEWALSKDRSALL